MNINRILCPVDYSTNGDQALRYAAIMANEFDAELHIIHTYQPDVPYEVGFESVYVPTIDVPAEESRLQAIVPEVEGLNLRHTLLQGEPAHEIVRYASENEIDLIVMSTHGRTGVVRLLMGSVAEHVLRMAECPVLTIRHVAKVAENESSKSR